MYSANPTSTDMQRAVNETIAANWVLFLIQGVIMMILGVIAVIWPQLSTVAADIYIGWLLLLSGVMGLVTMFWAPTMPAFHWSMLTAALSLIVGVLLLWHPVEGIVSLTLALVAFFIVEGLYQIATAIRYREAFPGSWGWMVMSGVVDLVLAGLVISGWPGTATWVLGLMVGANLVSSGLGITMAALAARSSIKAVASTAP